MKRLSRYIWIGLLSCTAALISCNNSPKEAEHELVYGPPEDMGMFQPKSDSLTVVNDSLETGLDGLKKE